MSISLGVVFYCWEWAISRSIAVFFFFLVTRLFLGVVILTWGPVRTLGGSDLIGGLLVVFIWCGDLRT